MESSSDFFILIFLWQEIPAAAGTLGEIVSNTYFTERSGVYFYRISIVFLLFTKSLHSLQTVSYSP